MHGLNSRVADTEPLIVVLSIMTLGTTATPLDPTNLSSVLTPPSLSQWDITTARPSLRPCSAFPRRLSDGDLGDTMATREQNKSGDS